MKKIALILLLTNTAFAGFFDRFIPPTPQKMFNFYNEMRDNMTPEFIREKRLEEQNADGVMEGEVINLDADGKKIFSIFIENDIKTATGVILLHTRGLNPNEEHLIKPLRIDMAENGYHTLSVQMPVLYKDAKYYDYVPLFSYSHTRIKAAIDFYKDMGVKDIVFVAQGCGAHMLMSYIDKWGDKDISAVVGIGLGATDTGQEMVKQYPLATMRAPVLDVFGSKDYGSVRNHAKTRLPHLALGSNLNQQVILKGAKHFHDTKKDFKQLTKTIYNFLDDVKNDETDFDLIPKKL